MTEFSRTPAAELARLIATREISPVAVTEAVLARAESLQPRLNMFARLMGERAMQEARVAEAAVMRGEPLGPLHGVPITIKDNIPIAGLPMANGSVAFADFVPKADAVVVERIRAAGAIIIGKTNLPEFAHKVLTDSPTFGVTKNPWNTERTPGGSSGGASAALAAGVAPLAVGTDGGGSIRCPASCTGTVGLKATLGRIPFETIADGFANYAFVGPMARTTADTALLFSIMAGPCAADPFSIAPGFSGAGPLPAAEGAARDIRIGWIEHFGRYRTAPEVASITSAAVASLAAAGAVVEMLSDACFDDIFDRYLILATTAHAARFGQLVPLWGERLTASIRASIAIGERYSAVEWQRMHDWRTGFFRAVQKLFERFDVIATPTMTAPPTALDAEGSVASAAYAEWAACLYPFNFSGHPAISVPAGVTADGLPVGLQLVGPWFGEQRLLEIASLLEQMSGWPARWPDI